MRKALCVLTGVVAMTAVANAGNLTLWFSSSPIDAGVPGQNPTPDIGHPLYLFGDTGGDVWNGIAIDLIGVDNVTMYNGELFSGLTRWEAGSAMTTPEITLVGATTQGLGGDLEPFGPYMIGGYYLIGEVIMAGCEVYVVNNGCALRGGTPGEDTVTFANNAPIAGNEKIALPNPIVIPEPASLAFLTVTGLFIRRR